MSDTHDGYDPAIEHAFTDEQWGLLRREDYKAGAAVVLLLLGIFCVGIFLYSIVAITL